MGHGVKGRAFAAEMNPRAKPGGTRQRFKRARGYCGTDPLAKPRAPATAPTAVDRFENQML